MAVKVMTGGTPVPSVYTRWYETKVKL